MNMGCKSQNNRQGIGCMEKLRCRYGLNEAAFSRDLSLMFLQTIRRIFTSTSSLELRLIDIREAESPTRRITNPKFTRHRPSSQKNPSTHSRSGAIFNSRFLIPFTGRHNASKQRNCALPTLGGVPEANLQPNRTPMAPEPAPAWY